MWWLLLVIPTIVFFIYCLIPSYWARNRSSKVLREGPGDRKVIALTFDDGPNPDYTPRLLDLLKEYNVKASFFIVGKRARLYPHIVRRIAREGHTLGCHSYSHRHAWFMTPFVTYKDMDHTYKILAGILGKMSNWYRPPWGGFNLMNLLIAKKLGLNMVYWSIEAQDWEARISVEHIYRKVIEQAAPGSIVLLHDNGGAPGAPEKTLEALPLIIKSLHKKGYKFVNIEQIRGDKNA